MVSIVYKDAPDWYTRRSIIAVARRNRYAQPLVNGDILPEVLRLRDDYIDPTYRPPHPPLISPAFRALPDAGSQADEARRILNTMARQVLGMAVLATAGYPDVHQPWAQRQLGRRRVAGYAAFVEVEACVEHHGQEHLQRGYLKLSIPSARKTVTVFAHRLVCWLAHGPPSNGLNWSNAVAGHLCSNSRCITPSHLRWLSRAENIACATWFREQQQREAVLGWPYLWDYRAHRQGR
jgi:hypothetical protein